MKVLIVADGHYYMDKQQNVYVESVFDYSFYARYLSAFDEVYTVARVETVDEPPKGCKLASGEHVHFLPIPPSRGLKQYAKSYVTTRKLVEEYVRQFEVAIFRVPGVVANLVSSAYKKTGRPYAIEVVVDPWEYFAKGTVKGITRPFVRRVWTNGLKRICKQANGVSYVTQYYLQKRYPCKALTGKEGYFTEHYSSVELPDDQFGQARTYTKKDKYIISHVANAFTGYGKGHLTLMNAAKAVIDKGYHVEVWFVGDGPLKQEFMDYAENLGLGEQVKFLGRLPNGSAVREKIKESDLFVFPTRAEGLPRGVLEAMAEGLPVLSSPVCGIPELLQEECLVAYDDSNGYADAIMHMLDDPDTMTRHSEQNLATAMKYKNSILTQRRNSFYSRVAQLVEEQK